MLIAEIRRKLADLEEIDPEESDSVEKVRLMLRETSEDLLTADVFGAIKYLPRIPYHQEVLRSIAENNPQAKKYRNHINFLYEYIEHQSRKMEVASTLLTNGMTDIDQKVRLAAFNWLDEQVSIHGDVLPRSVLPQGFEVESQNVSC